jgi:hypothetical protein
MTSQGTAHGRFQRAIHRRHVQAAEMAAGCPGFLGDYPAIGPGGQPSSLEHF